MPNAVNSQEDIYFMRLALREAAEAEASGDVPVGAVITRGKTVIGRGHNQTELLKDPTAHAEMIVITQAAAAIGDWRLTGCVLYVTKEPCPMCAGAIALARIPKVVFGACDPQNAGLIKSAEVQGGLLEEECKTMLQIFFKALRTAAKTPRGS
ncbi:MAG: nucleoside deaminase [Kiritimatiellae bacterium]|nr:nucleoside deaminase [Kiritimatiellia bacterium]